MALERNKILPDSGVDIFAAGTEELQYLKEHIGSPHPSAVTPKAVNSTKLHPLGKLNCTHWKSYQSSSIYISSHNFEKDLYIYPNISGALLSWKACKGLGILPDHYSLPITH